jgi:hypothetical protein
MLDIKLNLVASYYDTKNRERVFLSSSSEYFDVLSVNIIEDNKNIVSYLDEILYTRTNTPRSEHYLYNLLSVVKVESTVNINYCVLLPDSIKTNQDTYIIKSPVATIDPLVRKAMSYV